MTRVLLLIVLVWLVYIVIKRAFLSDNPNSSTQQNPKPEQKPEQKIVQCAACGMHVPESESIKKDQLVICNNPDCNKNP
ncbi:MAG: PP0621 family protein [Pseudomonadota bacterium]